jgi:GNAT superfamily N-acetyltransferase
MVIKYAPLAEGDLQQVIDAQARLYQQEHGFNEEFKLLLAQIGQQFVRQFDVAWDSSWIAKAHTESGARVVGSAFIVRQSPTQGQLRMLYVEPEFRGRGIGQRLVAECVAFARHRGYLTLMLWTNSHLHSARKIYQAHGFELTSEQPPQQSFGQTVVGQYWQLRLSGLAC